MRLQLTDLLRPRCMQEVHADHMVRVASGQEGPPRGERGAQHLGPRPGPLDELDGLGTGGEI